MPNVQLQYSSEVKPTLFRRTIIPASIAVAVLVSGVYLKSFLEPIIRWRLPFLNQQKICLNWVGPAGQVAYEEDVTEARRLSGGQLTGAEFSTLFDPNAGVLAYYSHPSVLAHFWYPEWGFQLVDQADKLLFLHSRKSPGHASRLICVRVSNLFPLRSNIQSAAVSPTLTPGLECTVIETATLMATPKILKHFWWSDPTFGCKTPKPTQIVFGVPDPADESRFSIPFQTPTEAKVIEGRLGADDMLQFTVVAGADQHPPTTRPQFPR